jgi:hypothetical protein
MLFGFVVISDVAALSDVVISLSVDPQDAKKATISKMANTGKSIRVFFIGKQLLS